MKTDPGTTSGRHKEIRGRVSLSVYGQTCQMKLRKTPVISDFVKHLLVDRKTISCRVFLLWTKFTSS